MTPPPTQPDEPQDSGAYELEASDLPRPDLPGKVGVFETADDAIDALAADLLTHAHECVRKFSDFQVALSGEASLEPFYTRLILDPAYRWLPWRRTQLWLTHERVLPFDHEQSCCRVLREVIGDHADIPPEQFHPIFAESETAADEYEQAMREALSWRERGEDRLDFALVTITPEGGSGGWTSQTMCSPEPGGAILRRVRGDALDVLAMDPAVINAARFVAVLVTGAEAASWIADMAARHRAGGEAKLPVEQLSPVAGVLSWYLDADAVAESPTV